MSQYRIDRRSCSVGHTHIRICLFVLGIQLCTPLVPPVRSLRSSGLVPWHFFVSPAASIPRNWDKDPGFPRTSRKQWAKYNITEIALNRCRDGFEGTAKSAEGETFKIKLKKDPATKSIRGTGVGDRGTELDYSVAAK